MRAQTFLEIPWLIRPLLQSKWDARDCVHVAVPFLRRLELLPSGSGSGTTALKKGTLRSASRGDWNRKFAGGGKCEPPSGTKRQQAAVCLPASILSKKVADPMGDVHLEVIVQEPGTRHSQYPGKVNLLQ